MGRPATPPGMTRKEMFVENNLAAKIKTFSKTHPGYPRDAYDYLLRLGLQVSGEAIQEQPRNYSGPEREAAYIEARATMNKYFDGSKGLYMRAIGEISGEKLQYWTWVDWRAKQQVPSHFVPKVRELAVLLRFLDGKKMLVGPMGTKK